jgi:hypothetical protein
MVMRASNLAYVGVHWGEVRMSFVWLCHVSASGSKVAVAMCRHAKYFGGALVWLSGVALSCELDGRGSIPGRGWQFFSSPPCSDRL